MLDVIEERLGRSRFAPVHQMVTQGVAAPLTSSAGRLFDAVAAIAGIRDQAAFEGQPAMELERIACAESELRYSFDLVTSTDPWRVDAAPLVRAIADQILNGGAPAAIAAGFHSSMASMIADVGRRLAARTGARYVALTGGVFQNARLLQAAATALESSGVTVLVHRRVPCNDGGLALGQAVAAARVLAREGSGDRHVCV
jgi:hydrogenase maturation protein HypF